MDSQLYYQCIGQGPLTIYLHGFLFSSSTWAPLNLAEKPGKHLFIDLPGHGKSPLLNAPHTPSIRFMANEVCRLLSELEISSFELVGHSMGGYVALDIFAQTSFGVNPPTHVTLLNSNCWTDSDTKRNDRSKVARIAYNGKSHFISEAIPSLFIEKEKFAEQIEAMKKAALTVSSAAIAYASLAMSNRKDYTEMVLTNPEKFTFIHGSLDHLVCVDEIQTRLQAITGNSMPKLCVIPKVGHMAHWENSDAVLGILEARL